MQLQEGGQLSARQPCAIVSLIPHREVTGALQRAGSTVAWTTTVLSNVLHNNLAFWYCMKENVAVSDRAWPEIQM